MRGERALPAAALLPHLKRAQQRREWVGHNDIAYSGSRSLAEDLADRLGVTVPAVLRQLVRMRRPGATVSLDTADRWSIALGLHPALVWGEAWWSLPDESATAAYHREWKRRQRERAQVAIAVGGGG